MLHRPTHALILAACWAIASGPLAARAQAPSSAGPPDRPRKVLVELYTSQGCNSCPPAADFLGQFPQLGYGPDRVIALNFHVDYFDNPWADPFADPAFSAREQSYNQVMKRTDLYFTPMMMVDGRTPMLGSNRPLAASAIRDARRLPAAVNLDLDLAGTTPTRKTLTLRLLARAPEAAGRDLLVGVALTQDRASTAVPSGENAGKTLVEHHVVRRFDHRFTRLDRAEPTTLTFAVELPAGGDPGQFRVVAFAQDRANGRVHQADAIRWTSAATGTDPGPSGTPPQTAVRVAK